MKLVVGLGNPGKEYKNTRHNIGFMVLDNYLGKVKFKSKFEAYIYSKEIYGEQVLFLKPLTYMNLSGLSVRKAMDYYKIDIDDILIIQDDLDIELGTYKIKKNSSSGGHNGIKSIISELKSDKFARLKIGIGKSEKIPTDKYVLSDFSTSDYELIESNFETFNNIIEEFIKNDLESAMTKYN